MAFDPPAQERLLKQNVRRITGQILTDENVIVGSCFVYDTVPDSDAYYTLLITSVHVLNTLFKGDVQERKTVQVHFPQVKSIIRRSYTAEILRFNIATDIALLRFQSKTRPPEEIQVAELGEAQDSLIREDGSKSRFVSYGFRQVNNYRGLPVHGHILDAVEDVNPYLFNLETSNVSVEMGGAPILDWDRDLVIGMLSINPMTANTDSSTVAAVSLSALVEIQGNTFYEKYRRPHASPRGIPRFDFSARAAQVAAQIRANLQPNDLDSPAIDAQAPILRQDILNELYRHWLTPRHYAVALIGSPGAGKSWLARQFIERLNREQSAPDAVFWWNFDHFPSVSYFINSALTYFIGAETRTRLEEAGEFDPLEVLGLIINNSRVLFILDGFERMLGNEDKPRDQYGLLADDLDKLQRFLDQLTLNTDSHRSMCLILSSIPLVNMVDRHAYYEHRLSALDTEDTRRLFEYLLKLEGDEQPATIDSSFTGQPLPLKLLAGLLAHPEKARDIPLLGGDTRTVVEALLRTYDNLLSKDELDVVQLMTIFRVPVDISGIRTVISESLNRSVDRTSYRMQVRDALVNLLELGLVKENKSEKYILPGLIRQYYRARLDEHDDNRYERASKAAGKYFASLAGQYDTQHSIRHILFGEAAYHLAIDLSNDDEIDELDSKAEFLEPRYLLYKVIASGGFGDVYYAYNIETQHNVAVKVIRERFRSGNAEETQRTVNDFRSEINILKELEHPNIIRIYDYKVDPEGLTYIVMPYYGGGSLKQRIKEYRAEGRRFQPDDVKEIIMNIGRALGAVHRSKIVHRDVSPGNIIFDASDNPYLIDFGLARDVFGKDSGSVAGMPGYTAPEHPTQRTPFGDQYSLATVALEMLTGVDAISIYDRVLSGEIEMFIDKAHFFTGFKPILKRALSFSPQDRYPTIDEFVDDLEITYWSRRVDTRRFPESELDRLAEAERKEALEYSASIPDEPAISPPVQPSNEYVNIPRPETQENDAEPLPVSPPPSRGDRWQTILMIMVAIGMGLIAVAVLYQDYRSDQQATATAVALVAIAQTEQAETAAALRQQAGATATASRLTQQAVLTQTAIPTASDTPTSEPTASDTPTSEPTASDTPTSEPTASDTPTNEPTATDTDAPPSPTGLPDDLPQTVDEAVSALLRAGAGGLTVDCDPFSAAYSFFVTTDELDPPLRAFVDQALVLDDDDETTDVLAIVAERCELEENGRFTDSGLARRLFNFATELDELQQEVEANSP